MDVRKQFLGLVERVLEEDAWYEYYAHLCAYTLVRRGVYDIRHKEVMGWYEDDTHSIIVLSYSAPSNDSDPYKNFGLDKDVYCEGGLTYHVAMFVKNNDNNTYALVYCVNDIEEDYLEDEISATIQDLGTSGIEELLLERIVDFKKMGA